MSRRGSITLLGAAAWPLAARAQPPAAAGSDPTTTLSFLDNAIHFIFSWVVLLPVAVIIAGKLLAKCVVLGFTNEDRFAINVYFFTIRASGDEVSLGLILFIVSLIFVIVVGGPDAYVIFKNRAGLDIGQWNSMCVIASFISLITSVLINLYFAKLKTNPIISKEEREEQIAKLQ